MLALSARFISDHFHRVLVFIRANLESTISVDDLAREAGNSPSHFGHLFKDTVGGTPMEYVLAYRIEQAIGMMKEHGDRHIVAIAMERAQASN